MDIVTDSSSDWFSGSGSPGIRPAHPQRGSVGRFIHNLPVQRIHQLCHTVYDLFCGMHAGIFVRLPGLPRKENVEIFTDLFYLRCHRIFDPSLYCPASPCLGEALRRVMLEVYVTGKIFF
jgi:hypothetical protein